MTKAEEVYKKVKLVVDDIEEIVKSNVTFDAGISIGAHVAAAAKVFGIDLGFRMDIVGVQYKDGEWRSGHIGHSSQAITIGWLTLGPQWSTFETWSGKIEDKTDVPSLVDFGPSAGQSVVAIFGGHWNVSVSYYGIATDLVNYFEDNF